MPGKTRLCLPRVNIPQFLDANGKGLRVLALAQIEFFEQCLGQMPATALGENGLFTDQLHSTHIAICWLTILADSHITGSDAADRTGLIIEDFGGWKAGINLNAKCLSLLGQPPAEIAKRDDVVAMIVHARRRWHPPGTSFCEEHEFVISHRRVKRGAPLLPIRDQLIE